MEGDFVKGQGEAVSATVVVDTASVTGYCTGVVASVSGIDALSV
jgi:hypothetical protein